MNGMGIQIELHGGLTFLPLCPNGYYCLPETTREYPPEVDCKMDIWM
jgi:hypothetical protein